MASISSLLVLKVGYLREIKYFKVVIEKLGCGTWGRLASLFRGWGGAYSFVITKIPKRI